MVQINPRLIQTLTNKSIDEIPESPTVAKLPGQYAKLINRNKEKVGRNIQNTFL